MGTCGEPTNLVDSFGKNLFVGDLVTIYNVEYKFQKMNLFGL